MIKTIDIKSGDTKKLYQYLSSAVCPRPIALVSTIDKKGNKNLAPFSFFNVFSVNPPILIFSPVTSSRTKSSKHTLNNVMQIKECVICLVNEDMAQQVSLTSCDYAEDINEFNKAGFTEIKSDYIQPSRVKESPINFECKVNNIVSLGEGGGAGNLVLAEVLKIHISNKILDDNLNIDPIKSNFISRYGGDWYGKTNKKSIYKIKKPISKIGIGIDQLPNSIKNSKILTGNDLAILASVECIPQRNKTSKALTKELNLSEITNENEKHLLAKKFLQENKVDFAWQILI